MLLLLLEAFVRNGKKRERKKATERPRWRLTFVGLISNQFELDFGRHESRARDRNCLLILVTIIVRVFIFRFENGLIELNGNAFCVDDSCEEQRVHGGSCTRSKGVILGFNVIGIRKWLQGKVIIWTQRFK